MSSKYDPVKIIWRIEFFSNARAFISDVKGKLMIEQGEQSHLFSFEEADQIAEMLRGAHEKGYREGVEGPG